MVTNTLFFISILLLALGINQSFEFGPAKATDLSVDQNDSKYSNASINSNGTFQTLVNSSKNKLNSSSIAVCPGSSFNASRLVFCQDETSKASPTELSVDGSQGIFTPSAALIAKDLSALSPSEIKEYGITDLSTDDLQTALNLLDKENLAKVLSNIPSEDLASIRKKIGPLTFDPILEKLSQNDRINITKKIPQT